MTTRAITATLTAYHSRRDTNGNTYWAFTFIDHETGKEVSATVSGGQSNVYGICRNWNPAIDDWDRSILFNVRELPIREFNRMVKEWPHAGCTSPDLAEYIRSNLD